MAPRNWEVRRIRGMCACSSFYGIWMYLVGGKVKMVKLLGDARWMLGPLPKGFLGLRSLATK
jgi:hypothetical protein